jgi:hypothetical protein
MKKKKDVAKEAKRLLSGAALRQSQIEDALIERWKPFVRSIRDRKMKLNTAIVLENQLKYMSNPTAAAKVVISLWPKTPKTRRTKR